MERPAVPKSQSMEGQRRQNHKVWKASGAQIPKYGKPLLGKILDKSLGKIFEKPYNEYAPYAVVYERRYRFRLKFSAKF
ncbi:Hypothetical predicted protein [Octopus vulgaris]|uniref:Uncharacterized protein n=1 Tax=Octopus vulgaris TaxID=6645 RepID=A0AA36AXZ7_OCTVU|nr:Hypothetical predicted protein [Octopus vulgaris]